MPDGARQGGSRFGYTDQSPACREVAGDDQTARARTGGRSSSLPISNEGDLVRLRRFKRRRAANLERSVAFANSSYKLCNPSNLQIDLQLTGVYPAIIQTYAG